MKIPWGLGFFLVFFISYGFQPYGVSLLGVRRYSDMCKPAIWCSAMPMFYIWCQLFLAPGSKVTLYIGQLKVLSLETSISSQAVPMKKSFVIFWPFGKITLSLKLFVYSSLYSPRYTSFSFARKISDKAFRICHFQSLSNQSSLFYLLNIKLTSTKTFHDFWITMRKEAAFFCIQCCNFIHILLG